MNISLILYATNFIFSIHVEYITVEGTVSILFILVLFVENIVKNIVKILNSNLFFDTKLKLRPELEIEMNVIYMCT